MSTIESIQYGIPTIAYISPNAYKQSGKLDKNNCPIINVKNKHDLKRVIKYYLNNKNELLQLSYKTKEYAENFHSFETVGNLWYNLYKSL